LLDWNIGWVLLAENANLSLLLGQLPTENDAPDFRHVTMSHGFGERVSIEAHSSCPGSYSRENISVHDRLAFKRHWWNSL
jgi:hypothetical protein